MSVVADASFFARALIPSQSLEPAHDRFVALFAANEAVVAPTLLLVEFSSALLGLQRRQAINADERMAIWDSFRDLPIDYRWQDAWADRAMEMAVDMGLGKVYDCLYLACAEAYRFDLLTCDVRFARAVGDPRVQLVG